MQTFERLVLIIENYVEADEIKSEDGFKSDLGMSSFDIVCMADEIKSTFEVELTASDFRIYKTVGEMAEYIASLNK